MEMIRGVCLKGATARSVEWRTIIIIIILISLNDVLFLSSSSSQKIPARFRSEPLNSNH
jgi:hypothetical protein